MAKKIPNGMCWRCKLPIDDHAGVNTEKYPESMKCPNLQSA